VKEYWEVTEKSSEAITKFESETREELYRELCKWAGERLVLGIFDKIGDVTILIYAGVSTHETYRVRQLV
jgi:hypothetical protein